MQPVTLKPVWLLYGYLFEPTDSIFIIFITETLQIRSDYLISSRYTNFKSNWKICSFYSVLFYNVLLLFMTQISHLWDLCVQYFTFTSKDILHSFKTCYYNYIMCVMTAWHSVFIIFSYIYLHRSRIHRSRVIV